MLELRVRACHVYGRFRAKDNRRPAFSVDDALRAPVRDTSRIVLPPANFQHEQEKIQKRWPAAVDYIVKHRLNEFLGGSQGSVGIIVQGGLYNTLVRALELLGLADSAGNTELPLYVLNVTYPLIDEEIVRFCRGKTAVLIVEEGQPEYIEQHLNTVLHRSQLDTKVIGKEVLPRAGEYTGQVLERGAEMFLRRYAPGFLEARPYPDGAADPRAVRKARREPSKQVQALAGLLPARPAGFCTGCPERPIFTAMKLLQREIGPMHISCDIGCHLFSILPPFNLGNTTMGYGLGAAGASAFSGANGRRALAVMGDGGFWHNGLTSGVGNSVFNQSDNVLLIVDNGYSAATGGQDILSSRAPNRSRSTKHPIAEAVKGVGVKWLRVIDRTYDLARMRDTLREAMTTPEKGPKVIVAASECMLNRQRRERPAQQKAIAGGERVVRERFGVDPDTCTGDHSCIRLSGCPSLTIRPNPDPLRQDPIAHVDNSCVGCGLCGEVAHAAVLCPSFYRAQLVFNPSRWDRLAAAIRGAIIRFLQSWADARRVRHEF
jgi:indolepyruvate ferredoxin oxidoreductase alpha subunit